MKYTAAQLYDSVHTFSTITCSRCGKSEDRLGNDDECLDGFFDYGWRATANHTYCPKCAEKYLKPKDK